MCLWGLKLINDHQINNLVLRMQWRDWQINENYINNTELYQTKGGGNACLHQQRCQCESYEPEEQGGLEDMGAEREYTMAWSSSVWHALGLSTAHACSLGLILECTGSKAKKLGLYPVGNYEALAVYTICAEWYFRGTPLAVVWNKIMLRGMKI